jgi:epoxyqueuosine reductase
MRPVSVAMDELAERLRSEAHRLGIARLGIARAAPRDGDRLRTWLDAGFAASMDYMGRHAALRADPRELLPGARSIVCCALHHEPGPPDAADGQDVAKVARYARGPDYHAVFKGLLQRLVAVLDEVAPGHRHRVCVDSAPVLERAHAQAAGIGWIGKNTCLIDRLAGSYFFLGEILTTVELPPDPPATDHCGTCTACLDACPTDALVEPYRLDARRCISYWTIEHRGEIPPEWGSRLHGWVFGCDLCQEACPFNRFAPPGHPDLAPHPHLVAPDLADLAAAIEASFKGQFRGTPITRAGKQGMLRNLALAATSARSGGESS